MNVSDRWHAFSDQVKMRLGALGAQNKCEVTAVTKIQQKCSKYIGRDVRYFFSSGCLPHCTHRH